MQRLDEEFADRVLPFDEDAAVHYAALVSQRDRAGRPISMADGTDNHIAGRGLATRSGEARVKVIHVT
ncbi:hypothetical protein AEMCBJ_32190 (plasmid) [Cupriavidus necator]|uniref:hypothetical protein n=1 Tax=Cupriavidus necator TaxID=106590 RepID=UPI003F732D94